METVNKEIEILKNVHHGKDNSGRKVWESSSWPYSQGPRLEDLGLHRIQELVGS